MKRAQKFMSVLAMAAPLLGGWAPCAARTAAAVVEPAPDPRLDWWREARFGMFIHWGLYAIPAGQWKDRTDHGEWIMTTGQIPVDEYEKFLARFNPVKFDADRIVRAAKAAGMRYIVITSKHHDGFCLFDSKETGYDVMATPFRRDIMKEMAEACRREGIRICWYHSIMDWHHPDYTPRRDWETRSAEGADFDRYVRYMKAQLTELLTNYGPIGVLWFDGQWEGTWTDTRGKDLYAHVRALQPDIIINNRVGRSGGSFGLNPDQGGMTGDFGTPEQEIPPTGIPGVDWETCMTMNDHWGYNRVDKNFKTTEDLIRKLADIASKGGNFLLNIGPTPEGEIPPESVDRLAAIGRWMDVNGDAIHGTQASPFPGLEWGRCTQRALADGTTRLYLHVFDWPKNGKLIVPGLLNDPVKASLLAAPGQTVSVSRDQDAIILALPESAPDPIDSVVVLDVRGRADVAVAPVISAEANIFVGALDVTVASDRERVELRYTLDGSDPTVGSPVAHGPLQLRNTATVSARAFRDGKAVSPVAKGIFTKVPPRPAEIPAGVSPGLRYEYFEKKVERVGELDGTPATKKGTVAGFETALKDRDKNFCFKYTGYLKVPADGVYRLYTRSDDGSALWIGDTLVVDNDKPHSSQEQSGVIALAAGLHPITVSFFENSGGFELKVLWSGPRVKKEEIPAAALWRAE